MKKLIALLLALMLIVSLAACAGNTQTTETTAKDESVVSTEAQKAGGWSIAETFTKQISDEDQAIFDKALEGYTGMSFDPIVKLGSQVVSGQNLMFLCEGTTITAEPVKSLKVVIVYVDLDGNAKIDKVNDFELSNYLEDKNANTEAGLAGGWTANEELKEGKIDADAKESFDNALAGFAGVEYTPLTVLGTQVVNGLNYAILCKGVSVTEEPVTDIYVLSIYAPAGDGNNELNSICALDLADFNK